MEVITLCIVNEIISKVVNIAIASPFRELVDGRQEGLTEIL